MNIDVLFERAYNLETYYLQHAWTAHNLKNANKRDKSFEKASGVRPKISLEETNTEDWKKETELTVKICTCGKTIEQVCPIHGTEDLDSKRP